MLILKRLSMKILSWNHNAMNLNSILVCLILGTGLLDSSGCSTPGPVPAQSIAADRPAECVAQPGVMRLAFATDRALTDGNDGTHLFGTGRSDVLRFGLVEMRFTAGRRMGALPQFTGTQITPAPNVSQVLRTLGPSRKPFLVFVPGFGEDFSTSVARAAQVVHDGCLDVVPIVFSWPTTRSFIDYGYDRDSANFARDDLALLLTSLVNEAPGRSFDLFAHSMGNRVALEALRTIALTRPNRKILDRVVLASADEDIDVFRRDLPSVLALANHVTVFTEPGDFALGLSSLIAGNQLRLGDARADDLTAHGIVPTLRLTVIYGEGLCNPFIHRCIEVSSQGLAVLRQILPWTPGAAPE